MAFLFAGTVFAVIFGTIFGELLVYTLVLLGIVALLFYKLVATLCRGFGFLLGVT
jgi:hypothetical protein